jgi:hypothetical protein
MLIPTQRILLRIQDICMLYFLTYLLFNIFERYNAVGADTEQMTIIWPYCYYHRWISGLSKNKEKRQDNEVG